LNAQQRQWLPVFHSALQLAPEETIVPLTLTQGSLLNLDANDAARLRNLFSNYYARVRVAEPFRGAPSALPYCFSDTKPASGLATIYVPVKVSPDTKELVFLHGYGGSLLAYVHYLATLFPDAIIICPAYGISPGNIPARYVAEARAVAAPWTRTLKGKPILIGLSAGGVGGCRVYTENSAVFERLVCLGSIPPSDAIQKFQRTAKVRFISGSAEPYVADGSFERALNALKLRSPNVRWKIIPNADHYFLLSHEEQTRKVLREFCSQ
jgi:pimeloyl-ACP methyl ester carboxylesterase